MTSLTKNKNYYIKIGFQYYVLQKKKKMADLLTTLNKKHDVAYYAYGLLAIPID